MATQDFDNGAILASIPKAAVLSIRTAACADLLERLSEDVPCDALLHMAIATERARGSASPWYGYLQTLPINGEPLPLLWPDAEITRLLAGTGLDDDARQRRRELAAEYKSIQLLLRTLGEEAIASQLDLTSYLHAATIASSRAFYVDEYHGEALVPFADLLNHKAALVPDDAIVEGGDESRRGHSRLRDAAQRAANLFGVSLEMDTTLHNLADLAEDDDDDDAPCVALVALRPLIAGDEVFNTYGEHDNRHLLMYYGFTLRQNPLDVAGLPWRAIRAKAVEMIGERAVRYREREWGWQGARTKMLCDFDCDGTPPQEMLDRLYDLPWKAELGSADVYYESIKAAGSAALAPVAVLYGAIVAHAASGYSPAALAAAARDEDEEDDPRAALVANIVRSELRVWDAAKRRLPPHGVVRAHPWRGW